MLLHFANEDLQIYKKCRSIKNVDLWIQKTSVDLEKKPINLDQSIAKADIAQTWSKILNFKLQAK